MSFKSVTFFLLPDRHKATMNEMSISRKLFLRVFRKSVLQFQSSSDCALPPYFDENDKPNRIYAVLTEITKLKDVSMD